MTALNWIGTGASLFGSKHNTFAKRFQGTFGVTIGNAISGNYGTTLESYFGPYINHCVDTGYLGLKTIWGDYLNTMNPFEATLSGIGGHVTWVYGANTTVNYGGPAGTVRRAQVFSKTGFAADAPGLPLGIGMAYGTDGKTPLMPAPGGHKPKGATAEALATKDKKVLLMVDLLSVLLNVTVATLELAAKFKYTSFDPKDHLPHNLPDPADDNYPLSGIDFILGFLPPRIMGIIYTIEMAGSLEAWGTGWQKGAEDFFAKIGAAVAFIPKLLEALLEKAGMSTEDAINTLIVAASLLGMLIAAIAASAAAGS